MAWSYDPSDLTTDTASGRLNVVRLLVGDTNTNDQQVQDEEITFALSETQDNAYYAASWVANSIASSYARKVDSEIDNTLVAKFSQLQKSYKTLSRDLREEGLRNSGQKMGVSAGGIKVSEVDSVESLSDRVEPKFVSGQFRYENDVQ